MRIRIQRCRRQFDTRGWLLKVVLPTEPTHSRVAEAYLVQAGVGSVRGNHYHRTCTEWFTPVRGRGRLLLEDATTGERQEVALSGASPVTVEIPPGVAHAIVPAPDTDLWVLALATHPHDPRDAVPYPLASQAGQVHEV